MAKLTKVSDIIEDINNNLTDKEIADKYSLGQSTVWRYVRLLRTNGFEIPKRKRGRRMLSL